MKERKRENRRFVWRRNAAMALAALLLPLLAAGQSLLLTNPPGENAKISLRSFWPTYNNLEFPSAMFDLYFRVPLNSRTSIIGAVPFLTLKQKENWMGTPWQRLSGIGDVSLGLQQVLKSIENRTISVTAGVFLPTMAQGDRYGYGMSLAEFGYNTDYAEFPKSMPGYATLFATAAYQQFDRRGNHFGLEAGPLFLIPAKGDYRGNPVATFLGYGVSGGLKLGSFDLSAEVAGRVQVFGFVDEVYLYFSHQAAVGLSWGRGPVRPGLFYTLRLNPGFQDFRGAFGVNLEIELGGKRR